MGEGVVGAREFLFPDSSSGQRSFWPILVEIWWVWFLGDTIPVDLGTTLPKTHFQEQARKRELRPPKQEAGTSMSRILIGISLLILCADLYCVSLPLLLLSGKSACPNCNLLNLDTAAHSLFNV